MGGTASSSKKVHEASEDASGQGRPWCPMNARHTTPRSHARSQAAAVGIYDALAARRAHDRSGIDVLRRSADTPRRTRRGATVLPNKTLAQQPPSWKQWRMPTTSIPARLNPANKNFKLGAAIAATFGAAAAVAFLIDLYRFTSSIAAGGSIGKLRDLCASSDAAGGNRGGVADAEPTVILDVRGRVVATLNSEAVPLESVSDNTWRAIVSSEDHRFFMHRGVDVAGLFRAITTLGRGGGGSTITQQLCKNLLLTQERTITRKLVEVLLALFIETRLTKPELLERYLNTVYFGHGLYGIAAASAGYFRKKPQELTITESAMLAGLLPAPEFFSPYRDPDGALRAQREVLLRMNNAGFLDDDEFTENAIQGLPPTLAVLGQREMEFDENGRPLPLQLHGAAAPFRAPFFVSEVLYQLRELLGPDALNRRGGLLVHTTLDLSLQERAEEILREDGMTRLAGEDKGEAALVAMEPSCGAVRVLVGGRTYEGSPYNRAVLARRSPGSAFKPVVYLTAMDLGKASPSTEVEDEEVVFRRSGGGWRAVDDSDSDEDEDDHDESTNEAGSSSANDAQRRRDYANGASASKPKDDAASNREGGDGDDGTDDADGEKSTEASSKSEKAKKKKKKPETFSGLLKKKRGGKKKKKDSSSAADAEGGSTEKQEEDEDDYRPMNYNRKYRGTVTLRDALADSLNIPTVKLADAVGIDKVTDMARRLGVRSPLPQTLSLSLGACEVTPFEIGCMYNTIAAGGVYSRPHLVTKVQDRGGETLYKFKPVRKPACKARACGDLHRMLRAAVTKGTGRAAIQGWPAAAAAGKTGTSDDYRDAWFAGYTPSMSCVVWCGRDDNSSLPGTGATLAAPIWARFMRAAHGQGISAEKGHSRRQKVAKWRQA